MSREPFDYFGLAIPYLDHIGLEPLEFGEGRAKTRLPMVRALMNSRGECHGGALMSALDFTMSAAARAAYGEPMGAATIDMSSTFFSTARVDMTIEARVIKAGKSLAFTEGEVRDAAGELLARATATFRMLPKNGAK